MVKWLNLVLTVVLVFCILASLNVNVERPAAMFTSQERMSPQDRIPSNQIHVFGDRVVIEVEDPSWASFADTNSMDPFIDAGANSIEVRPSSPEDIQIGDVVSYHSDGAIIVHRVVMVGSDDEGLFYLMKGDNNNQIDPEKVRFDQINGVLVAVIY
jgi:signal peptidase I